MSTGHTCDECGKALSDLNIRHGWLTVQVSWRVQARVHTLCRARFLARSFDEQKARAA